jgi:hypothetical protein
MTQTATHQPPASAVPLWFWIVAALGLAWNLFGAVQFIASLSATSESLQAQGMTPDQAAVMLGYPVWMTIWNAPSEVVHPLGYDYPVFRRTRGWLGSERSPRTSC